MFDPYHRWLGIPKDQRPPTHYQLLAIQPDEKDPEVIEEAAVRQTTHVRTYQIGQHSALCTRILNEIAQARRTLLDPAKRTEYDAQLSHAQLSQRTGVKAAGASPASQARVARDQVSAQAPAPAFNPFAAIDLGQDAEPAPLRDGPSRLGLWLGVGGGAIAVVAVVLAIALSGGGGDGAPKKDGQAQADAGKKKPPLVKPGDAVKLGDKRNDK